MKIHVKENCTVDGVSLTARYMEITDKEEIKRLKKSAFLGKKYDILEDDEELPEDREQFKDPFKQKMQIGAKHSGPDAGEYLENLPPEQILEGPKINELRTEAKRLGIKSAGKSKVALIAEIEKAKIDG